MDGAVLDVGLVGQVVRRADGHLHPLDGQEGGQVGGVGGDDDQGEGPPAGQSTGVMTEQGGLGYAGFYCGSTLCNDLR